MQTNIPKIQSVSQLPQVAANIFAKTAQQAQASRDSLMKRIVMIIRADAADFFDKEQGPSGQKWRPLKHPRPNSAGQDKALQDTGKLRRAATGDAPGNITRISGNTIEHGVNLIQANLMNFGGVITPKNGKFLSIPLTVKAKRAGSPTRFPGKLHCIINKRGTGGILYESVRKKKRGAKNKGKSQSSHEKIVHYALTKRVEVPARPFIGISKKGMENIQEACVDHYFESLKAVVVRGGN